MVSGAWVLFALSYARAVLRLVGALLVMFAFTSGTAAQGTFQMEAEPEEKKE